MWLRATRRTVTPPPRSSLDTSHSRPHSTGTFSSCWATSRRPIVWRRLRRRTSTLAQLPYLDGALRLHVKDDGVPSADWLQHATRHCWPIGGWDAVVFDMESESAVHVGR